MVFNKTLNLGEQTLLVEAVLDAQVGQIIGAQRDEQLPIHETASASKRNCTDKRIFIDRPLLETLSVVAPGAVSTQARQPRRN